MDTYPKRNIRFRRIGLLVFLASAHFSPLAARPDIVFAEDLFPELKSLISEAMEQSAQLQVDSLRIEEREGDLDVVKGQRRPSANLYGRVLSSYETRDDIEDRFRGSTNASLTVRQPLYQWDNLKRRETIARHRVTLEELESGRKGSSQIMQIRQAYLQWLLMRERRTILQQSIDLSDSYVEARRKLVEVGISSEQDVLEMEARLLENRENLAYVEKVIFELERRFLNLVGPEFDMEALQGASLNKIEPISGDHFRELRDEVGAARVNFLDPASARLDLLETIEDEQLAILDKQNWPTFDLVAGIYTDHLDAINQNKYVIRIQYYAGLQVNWNIFDGWQSKGYKRSALARKRGYSFMREQAEQENRSAIDSRFAEISLNLKQIEARGKRANLLERRVELLRQQIQQNQVSGVELMKGEIDFLEVRQRLMQARVDYLMNMMELGVLIEEDPALTRYRGEE